ncbi:MAG: hypothetical protein ABWY00_10240 [Dongiaceae bacterium]
MGHLKATDRNQYDAVLGLLTPDQLKAYMGHLRANDAKQYDRVFNRLMPDQLAVYMSHLKANKPDDGGLYQTHADAMRGQQLVRYLEYLKARYLNQDLNLYPEALQDAHPVHLREASETLYQDSLRSVGDDLPEDNDDEIDFEGEDLDFDDEEDNEEI